jgi:hypothetical protein
MLIIKNITDFLRKSKFKRLLRKCKLEIIHSDNMDFWGIEKIHTEKLGDIKIIDSNGYLSDISIKQKYDITKLIKEAYKEAYESIKKP